MICFKIVAKVQKKGGIYHIFTIARFDASCFKRWGEIYEMECLNLGLKNIK